MFSRIRDVLRHFGQEVQGIEHLEVARGTGQQFAVPRFGESTDGVVLGLVNDLARIGEHSFKFEQKQTKRTKGDFFSVFLCSCSKYFVCPQDSHMNTSLKFSYCDFNALISRLSNRPTRLLAM